MTRSAEDLQASATYRQARSSSFRRSLPKILLAGTLLYGGVLRSWHLGEVPLWTDEAESCINALTILEHGVPRDQYLGLPIFENTLTRAWPDHPEYEFRDTSYSDRGLAIYHGWLPLYTMAASFAVAGVKPDGPASDLRVRHSEQEMYRRTAVARIPSVIFSLMFLGAIFLAAREFYGNDAAWAGIAAATVSSSTIKLARQARYYSLTLALTALCALSFGRMVKRGWRRDFVGAGVLLLLLFHTNILAFVAAFGALGILIPFLWGRRGLMADLFLVAVIVGAGTVPWVAMTGFASSAADRPMARSLLTWSDLPTYAMDRRLFFFLAAGTLIWLVAIRLFRDRIPRRCTVPFAHASWGFWFLAGWASVAFIAFNLFIPAASYFHARLTVAVLVPTLLFGAMLAAAVARMFSPRTPIALPVGLLVLLLYSSAKTTFWWPTFPAGQPHIFHVVERLRSLDLQPGTRLYADTGVSLPLMFYSGLPVQNVMPVRAAFLEDYEGEVVIVEGPRTEGLSWPEVQTELSRQGLVSEKQARRTAGWFNEQVGRANLASRVAMVHPSSRPAPAMVETLVTYHKEKTEQEIAERIREAGNPMFRGYRITDYTTFWQVFFYRFVEPEMRLGANLNYSRRIRNAEAFVLPGGWALIRSPHPATSGTGSTSKGRV